MPIEDLTDEEKRTLKGAIRRAFRQSSRMRDVLKACRVELPPALKKDGNPGLRPQVRFKCAVCGDLFPGKWIAVDHINPVVPLDKKEKDMTPNDLVNGIYCEPENLQPICVTPIKFLPKNQKSCHAKKTAEENFIRKGLAENGGSVLEWKERYKDYLCKKEIERLEKEKRKLEKAQKKKRS